MAFQATLGYKNIFEAHKLSFIITKPTKQDIFIKKLHKQYYL
jgi:hypothetical protein